MASYHLNANWIKSNPFVENLFYIYVKRLFPIVYPFFTYLCTQNKGSITENELFNLRTFTVLQFYDWNRGHSTTMWTNFDPPSPSSGQAWEFYWILAFNLIKTLFTFFRMIIVQNLHFHCYLHIMLFTRKITSIYK